MTMSPRLAAAMAITEAVMLAYWSLSGLQQAGAIHIPPEWLYAHHDQAQVVAWNWSFLPLDLTFSFLGVAAVGLSRRGHAVWRPLALLSLALTSTAGLMAVSYWTLTGDFEPAWFLPNLALTLWPLAFLPRLARDLGAELSEG